MTEEQPPRKRGVRNRIGPSIAGHSNGIPNGLGAIRFTRYRGIQSRRIPVLNVLSLANSSAKGWRETLLTSASA